MELFKIILFEYLLGYALQGFIIVLGIYAFNRKRIEVKSYVLTSLLTIIVSFLVRMLPISFGVHTILNMLFLFLICIMFLKMPGFSTIRSALLVTVILLVSEMANVAVVISIIGKAKFENQMLFSSNRAIIGLPGALFFAVLIILAYYFSNYRLRGRNGIDGKMGEENC
ncbi:hypothetical protein [Parasporobacterium paucivorans]|uniref:Uncharacterized protein n=1 Tax=Parasporobacterium paucivorans DSM 15970 TaxID=1122934 RepID=A0A1M6GFJ5_9FIRM|nr:hypothetical protein [Parasporobacterium paucivorans]SHJ08687.1 hypothetical protein SAMN02745691_01312 [Parasporobacterium paucivorans DSM 15970]